MLNETTVKVTVSDLRRSAEHEATYYNSSALAEWWNERMKVQREWAEMRAAECAAIRDELQREMAEKWNGAYHSDPAAGMVEMNGAPKWNYGAPEVASYVPRNMRSLRYFTEYGARYATDDGTLPRVVGMRRLPAARYAGMAEMLAALTVAESDGFVAWQGTDYSVPMSIPGKWNTGNAETETATGTAVLHAVPGRRAKGKPKTEHVAFCHATDGYVLRTRCQEYGKVAGWNCPRHGAENVIGTDLPVALDSGATLIPKHARKVQAKGSKANPKPTDVRYGVGVRPEPTDVVMADYAWPTPLIRGTEDDGKILVYGADGTLLAVANRDGTEPKVSPSKDAIAALTRRDGNVPNVLKRQLAGKARLRRSRSRSATVAATAGKATAREARIASMRERLHTAL